MHRAAVLIALFSVLSLFPGQVLAGGWAQSVAGSLNRSSPRWDRIKDSGSTIDPNCGATAPDSYNDGVPFALYALRTDTTQNLVLNVAGQPGSLFDPFVALYCDPFSPRNPAANLIAADDDGGGYPAAAVDFVDGVTLQAGLTYYLVVTSYSLYAPYGDFQLNLGSADITLEPLHRGSVQGLWLLLQDPR